MKIYFVSNNKWYSRLMRFLYDTKMTHIGIGFDFVGNEFIFDISKPKGSLYPSEIWFEKYYIVDYINIQLDRFERNNAIDKLWMYWVAISYDMPSYYLSILFGIMNKVFGIDKPKSNPVKSKHKRFCTNILEPLKPILKSKGIDINDVDTFTKLPSEMYDIMSVRKSETQTI